MQTHDPLWTDHPEAQALLKSCRRHPPALKRYRQHFGVSNDVWDGFVGPRADRLEKIRERHLCDVSGGDWDAADPDVEALKRYLELSQSQPSVEDAILTAIEGLHYLTADVAVPLGAAA